MVEEHIHAFVVGGVGKGIGAGCCLSYDRRKELLWKRADQEDFPFPGIAERAAEGSLGRRGRNPFDALIFISIRNKRNAPHARRRWESGKGVQ